MEEETLTIRELKDIIINKYLGNVPELKNIFSTEDMYKILDENFDLFVVVGEDQMNDVEGLYRIDEKSITLKMHDNDTDVTNKNLKSYSKVLVHESIHALFARYRQKVKRMKNKRTIKKVVGLYNRSKIYFGKLDELIEVCSKQCGTNRYDLFSNSFKNIRGIFLNEEKYKFSGSLKYGLKFMKGSFLYRKNQKGVALNEGITEWLAQRAFSIQNESRSPETYRSQVKFVNQIFGIIGTNETVKLNIQEDDENSKSLFMSKKDYNEFMYRLDEALKADYRKTTLNRLEKNLSKDELSKEDIDELKEYGLWGLRKKPEKADRIFGEMKMRLNRVHKQNSRKAESILIQNTLTNKLKKELKINKFDSAKFIELRDMIEIFEANSPYKNINELYENDEYLNVLELYKQCVEKFIIQNIGGNKKIPFKTWESAKEEWVKYNGLFEERNKKEEIQERV